MRIRPTHILTTGILLAFAPLAASAAIPVEVGLSSREKLLLAALVVSGLVLITALAALTRLRYRIRKHVKARREELRRAFADAYVGLKDNAADASKVRDAAQSIEKVITDLENFI